MHVQLANDGAYTLLPHHGLKDKQTVGKSLAGARDGPVSTATNHAAASLRMKR